VLDDVASTGGASMQQPAAEERLNHQVKNRLARLRLALELLEAEKPLSEIQQAFVSTASRAVAELEAMLRDELTS
jgi:hypothetical protein